MWSGMERGGKDRAVNGRNGVEVKREVEGGGQGVVGVRIFVA